MIREANFDLNGPLIYNNRYKQFYKRNESVSYVQKYDQVLMIRAAITVFGADALLDFGFEWPDRIPDYLDHELTKKNTHKLVQVYFDHYLFIKYKNKVYPFLGETDDESHRNQIYCCNQGWNFFEIKYKDERKDKWSEVSHTPLFRLPSDWNNTQKFDFLINFFNNAKTDIESQLASGS